MEITLKAIFLAAAVLTAFGAITVLAQGPGPQGRGRGPGGPGGPGGPNILAMVRQLDLSDAQREQLRQIMEEGRQAADPGAIETLKAAVNAGHAAELDQRIAMLQKVAQILTPAQRQQLLKLPPPG